MSSKCLFISLILTTLLCCLASTNNEASGVNQRLIIYTNFMKMNEKFDFLSEKVNKLEENLSAGNDTIFIAIEQLNKQTQELSKRTEEFNKQTEELKKTNNKISKIEQLLLQLMDQINDQKMMKREVEGDVMGELTSQCQSLCQSKVNTFAHDTRLTFNSDLNKLDFCLQNSTFANACQPNPCSKGEQCQTVSYQCTKCPYLRSGNNCQVLECSLAKKCIEFRGQMYVVFEEHMLWEDAYIRCAREGMRLATPKDKETTEFLIGQLKSMYLPAQHKHFYIGMKNLNGGGEWRWTDGSLLGEYVGGYSGGAAAFKKVSGQLFAILYLHAAEYGVPLTYWHPQSLSEILKGTTYYPLCTKPIGL